MACTAVLHSRRLCLKPRTEPVLSTFSPAFCASNSGARSEGSDRRMQTLPDQGPPGRRSIGSDQISPYGSPGRIGRVQAQSLDEWRLHDEALAPIRQQKTIRQLCEHTARLCVLAEPDVQKNAATRHMSEAAHVISRCRQHSQHPTRLLPAGKADLARRLMQMVAQ